MELKYEEEAGYWITDGNTNEKGYYHQWGKGSCHKPYKTYKAALRKATRFNNQSKRHGTPDRYFVATWSCGNLIEVVQ